MRHSLLHTAGNVVWAARAERTGALPLLTTYARLKAEAVLSAGREGRTRRTTVLGMPVTFFDYYWLLEMYEEIFLRKQYQFEPESQEPVILDAGSNIGLAILFFKWVFPRATVVGFEPDPEAFELLTRNVSENRLEGVRPQPGALRRREESTSTAIVRRRARRRRSRRAAAGLPEASEQVPATRLSEHLEESRRLPEARHRGCRASRASTSSRWPASSERQADGDRVPPSPRSRRGRARGAARDARTRRVRLPARGARLDGAPGLQAWPVPEHPRARLPEGRSERPAQPGLHRRRAGSMSSQSLLHDVVAAKSIEAEWDALAERTCSSPFVRPGWIRAWHDAFGRGELRVLTVRRAAAIRGTAARLGRRTAPLPRERAHACVRAPRGRHSGDVSARARALPWRRSYRHAGTLSRGRGGSARVPDGGAEAGYRRLVTPWRVLPTSAAGPRSRSTCARRAATCATTSSVGSAASARRAPSAIEIADGHERLSDLLEEGFALERLGVEGCGGYGDRVRRADAAVLRRHGDVGGVARLAAACVPPPRRRAIAFQLDLEAGLHVLLLKIGYDPDYERFSPGKCLAYVMVSRAASTGLETYELLGTEEPWKHRWTDVSRLRDSARFAPSVVGFFAWCVRNPRASDSRAGSRLASRLRAIRS